MAKTEGEALFQQYATDRGFSPVYEPNLRSSEKRPDFLLETPTGNVLCEIEQFSETEEDRERNRQLAKSTFASGGGDPWKRIRNTVEDGCRQLKPFAGQYPLVVILFESAETFICLDNYMIQTALHGNESLILDGESLDLTQKVYSRDHAFLWKEFRDYLSAVAVIERFRPLEDVVGRELRESIVPGDPVKTMMAKEVAITERILTKHPSLSIHHEVLRVRVVHNPFADHHLPVTVFTGPFDEQSVGDPSTGEYKLWSAFQ